MLRFLTAGESHGRGLVVIVEGLPAGLPVVVDDRTHAWLIANPNVEITIDVGSTTLTLPDGAAVKFPLEGFAKYCLMNGVDELGFLLSQSDAINRYEAAHR